MNLHEALKTAIDVIKEKDVCYVGVLDDKGYPTVSARNYVKPNGVNSLFICTGTKSNLPKRLKRVNKIGITIFNEYYDIKLIGTAIEITDKNIKDQFWVDGYYEHFLSKDDPNYCIIKFNTKHGYLNDIYFESEDILKVQSYCGLFCSTCGYMKSHGCKGCKVINGKPFWGECVIAKCCIEKGYDHCGQCLEVPCDNLKDFSCGDDSECDTPKGSRIEVVKMWNNT